MVHIKQIRGVPSYLSLSTPLTPQGVSTTQVITGQKTWTTSPGTNDRVSLARDVPGRFDSNGTDEAAAAVFGSDGGLVTSTFGFWGGSTKPNAMMSWLPVSSAVNGDYGRFLLSNSRTETGDAWDPITNSGVSAGISGLITYYTEFAGLRSTVPVTSSADLAPIDGLPAAPLTIAQLKLFSRQGNPAFGYNPSPSIEFGLSYMNYGYPSGTYERDLATVQLSDLRYNEPRTAQIQISSLTAGTTVYPMVAPTNLTLVSISLVGNTGIGSPGISLQASLESAASPGRSLFASSPSGTLVAGQPLVFTPDQNLAVDSGEWLSMSWAGGSPLTDVTISVSYQPIYPT